MDHSADEDETLGPSRRCQQCLTISPAPLPSTTAGREVIVEVCRINSRSRQTLQDIA